MKKENIEKYFCNNCKGKTKHFIREEHSSTRFSDDGDLWQTELMQIVECCGCGNLAFVKKIHFCEDFEYCVIPDTGEFEVGPLWVQSIYPPVNYRVPPTWLADLLDPTLKNIAWEIYKSLETESHYLATFGSRTLIDRLIFLTVGDQDNFGTGLDAMQTQGKISQQERDILVPVIQAGHAAAHRGWEPTEDQLKVILDTVEGLIHRLLVLPSLSDKLERAVPNRGGGQSPNLASE